MTFLAGGRAGLFHGVAGPAHPVGAIFAETWDMPGSDLFPVALLAIAFVVVLVRPVRKGDTIFQLENVRTVFSSKCGYCDEKDCRS
jgi:hypothetical protein